MANYTTGRDLVASALTAAGENSTGISRMHDEAVCYVVEAYRSLCLGGREWNDLKSPNWWWLKTTGIVTLEPDYDTGTVAVTQNSTTATLSGASSASLAGWFLSVAGNDAIYKISAHTAATTGLTLDAVYTGDTDAAVSYTAYKIDYALESDILRVMQPMEAFQGGAREVGLLDEAQFKAEWPLNGVRSGTPSKYMMVDDATVRFNRSGGDDYVQVRYSYLEQPTDLADSTDSIPLVPLFYRKMLSDMAASWLLVEKNDGRATDYGAMAMAALRAMLAENSRKWGEQNRDMLFRVRPNQRQVLRSTSGLYFS